MKLLPQHDATPFCYLYGYREKSLHFYYCLDALKCYSLLADAGYWASLYFNPSGASEVRYRIKQVISPNG